MMPQLNLPDFQPRIRTQDYGPEIFDDTRRRFVRLTLEEWVRQHFIHFMISQLGFPQSLIVVEGAILYHSMKKRFDILVYDLKGAPRLIVECKAPTVAITQAVFDQVATYNVTLKVDYLLVTNGLVHYACHVNHLTGAVTFMETMPGFELISG